MIKQYKSFVGRYEIKSESTREFEGYGSVFGVVDFGGDRVLSGAFKGSLERHTAKGLMPALLWQHDQTKPIGVDHEMREDEKGLYVRGELADTQLGREAYVLMKMSALSGLSIGYGVLDDSYDRDEDVRDLKEIELFEVSPVTFPMCDEARVEQVKTAGSDYKGLERILRDAGFSRSEAKVITSRGLGALREVASKSTDLTTEQADALVARFQ